MALCLIGHYDSPFVRRVGVSLHILGMPFERQLLSVFSNAGELRAYNPVGRVPALVLEDGEVLVDSAAILDHLDEVAGPERALMPASGAARRDAMQKIVLATGINDKAVAITYERRHRGMRPTPAGSRAAAASRMLRWRPWRIASLRRRRRAPGSCSPRLPSRRRWAICGCGSLRRSLQAVTRRCKRSRPGRRPIPPSRLACRRRKRSAARRMQRRPHFCACGAASR
jgi:glutathione S-transferase